jgi:hypothetical protein
MPIIRSAEVNQQTAYDVQHWSCCVRLAEKRQVLVHLLGVKRRLVMMMMMMGIMMPETCGANYINKPQLICI